MKLISKLTVLLLLCFAIQASAQLVVTEINSSSDATDDWFELTNIGSSAIDMTGYGFDDFPENVDNVAAILDATGAGILVQPGESVVVLEFDTELGTTAAEQIGDFRSCWGGLDGIQIGFHTGSGLGRDDGVSIFDAASNLVAQEIYFDPSIDPPLDQHAGESVGARDIDSAIWDPTTSPSIDTPAGNVFIEPILGENGVIAACDTGLGSPGAVVGVPEPSSILLIMMAVLGITAYRKRS